MERFAAFLPSVKKHLLCSAPGSPGHQLPRVEQNSFRNDVPCQPREDEATHNMLLSDCPPVFYLQS